MPHYLNPSGQDLAALLLPSTGVSMETKYLQKTRWFPSRWPGKVTVPLLLPANVWRRTWCPSHSQQAPTSWDQHLWPLTLCSVSSVLPHPHILGFLLHMVLSPSLFSVSAVVLAISLAAPKPRHQASQCSASRSEQIPCFFLQGWKHLRW